jgi:glutathione-regulated potassium-efflux system ancillary protein KefF
MASTGALDDAYGPEGGHGHPIDTFARVIEQTARFCGMQWDEPLIVHGAHRVGAAALQAQAARYAARLQALAADVQD